MIRTEHTGEHVCECNECGETEYGGTQDFAEFVADLKVQGWRIFKDKGDSREEIWCHECPECQEEN